MNFDLNEDQTLLKAGVERFVADRYGGDIERRRGYLQGAHGFSAHNWRMLADLGILGIPFDVADGGLGGGPIEIIVAAEAFGEGLVVEPWLTSLLMAGRLLADAGTPVQRAEWLPQIIAGKARLALAQAEPDGRYTLDTSGMTVRGNVISGCKTFVLAGPGADAFIVSARGSDGLQLYLVPSDASGLDLRPYRLADSTLAAEVTLHGVTLPESARLQGGLAALEAAASLASLAACGEMLGLAGLLLRTTIDYARTRRQFGVPIGSFQVLQHRLVDDYAAIEQARSLTLRAAMAGTDAQIAGARAYVGGAAVAAAHTAVQIHGGMGMTEDLAVGHALKRVLVLSRLFGDSAHHLRTFAESA